jgi:hypothetical protein
MDSKFEMGLVGELSYFLGLQVKQVKDYTSISQSKYTKKLMEELGMKGAKKKKTPKAICLKLAKEQEVSIEQSIQKHYRQLVVPYSHQT